MTSAMPLAALVVVRKKAIRRVNIVAVVQIK